MQVLKVVGGFGLVLAAAGTALAVVSTDRWFDDLWLEVAKAGVQIIAVGVLGGALATAWRTLDRKRERERRERDKIRVEITAMVTLYNDVKSVRRVLRSLGFESGTGQLTQRQADGFNAQMLTLNALQLGFESKMRWFGQTDSLGTDTEHVVRLLHHVEAYLNGVLRPWEQGGWTIGAGSEMRSVSAGLDPLFDTSKFRSGASEPLNEITAISNQRVFSKASEKTKETLASIPEN